MASLKPRMVYVALVGVISLGCWIGAGSVTASDRPDRRAGEWRDLRPIPDPPGAQQEHAVVAVHDKIYVVGGTFCHEKELGECPSDTNKARRRVFSAYDTKTNTWQRLPDLPQPRDHLAGAFFGDRLYVFGGRSDSLNPLARFNNVFVFDLPTGRWSEKAPMPTRRSETWLGVIGEAAHLMGRSGKQDRTDGTFANHEVYDFARDRWPVLPAMPHPRHGPATVVIGSTICLPGGSTHQTVGVTPIFVFRAHGGHDHDDDGGHGH